MDNVQVYWNLHKETWSIRKNGRVIAHTRHIMLENVEFRVQPAGRARVIREGRKNVHAYAKGNLEDAGGMEHPVCGREITYNPFKFETFVYADDLTPVKNVDRVFMSNRKVWEIVDA